LPHGTGKAPICREVGAGADWVNCAMAGVPSTFRRLKNAEFVSVRVGEYVPAPAPLGHWRAGQPPGSQPHDTVDLGIQADGAQIQVESVLPALDLGHLLQEDLDSLAAGRNQSLTALTGRTVAGVPEHAGPELR